MRRRKQPDIAECLASLIISLVCIHGLVTSPLLVECVRADGHSIIELIGQDPCRLAAGGCEADEAAASSRAGLGKTLEKSEPCVDLALENLGLRQTRGELVPATSPAKAAPADFPRIGSDLPDFSMASSHFKMAREPVDVPGCDPHLSSCLRI
jgi:hypothetical protein